MNLRIASKLYNSKIRIYYQEHCPDNLAAKIIEYVWLLPEQSKKDADFQLIQATKATVYKVTFDSQVYYIKSYAYRNTSKVIKNLFRPIDALRCFQTGIKLKIAGIPVLEPIMALTIRRNAMLVDSIFVTKEVPGIDLYSYLSKHNQDPNLRQEIIRKIAVIWSKLINHGLLHLDPWLGNFMVDYNEGELALKLIDIDNIYSLPFVPQKILLLKNLAKLKGNQLNTFCASPSEINLFFKEFTPRCNILKHSSLSRFLLPH